MSYTKSQVAEITGLEPRQVQFYTERTLVNPEVEAGQGRGRVRRYSKKNLLEFVIIHQLFGYGITVSKIQMILDAVRLDVLDKILRQTDSFIIIYQRENGRYMKIGFRLSANKALELQHIDDYDSALVINLRRVLSNLN